MKDGIVAFAFQINNKIVIDYFDTIVGVNTDRIVLRVGIVIGGIVEIGAMRLNEIKVAGIYFFVCQLI